MSILKEIDSIVKSNRVALFMKGTPDQPMCGFSAVVVRILNILGVDYEAIDVLSSDDMRQGIKKYGDWPTIPQLYVNSELVGGCDIIKEMYEDGSLKNLLQQ